MESRNVAARGGLIAALLAALTVLLAIATVWQSSTNRALQRRIADNQTALAKAQTIANVDNSLVQLLAKAAVDNNDPALRDLLARNGVTLKQNAAATGGAANGQ